MLDLCNRAAGGLATKPPLASAELPGTPMMLSQPMAEPILSTLADDPDLGSIVELYVAEMPGRVATLLAQFDAGDRCGLSTTAHQIKGAAGSHGFHQVTPIAARLETALRDDRTDAEISEALEALVDACRRVRWR